MSEQGQALTWEINLWHEVSETFDDVADLEGPEQASLEETKLQTVDHVLGWKRFARPDQVDQNSQRQELVLLVSRGNSHAAG